jgi:hypothetical protein
MTVDESLPKCALRASATWPAGAIGAIAAGELAVVGAAEFGTGSGDCEDDGGGTCTLPVPRPSLRGFPGAIRFIVGVIENKDVDDCADATRGRTSERLSAKRSVMAGDTRTRVEDMTNGLLMRDAFHPKSRRFQAADAAFVSLE